MRQSKHGFIDDKGYRRIRVDGLGYIREHRHVMEIHLGRKLSSEELVHHIDCDKLNNDLSNLMVVSSTAHRLIHYRIDKADRDRFQLDFWITPDQVQPAGLRAQRVGLESAVIELCSHKKYTAHFNSSRFSIAQ